MILRVAANRLAGEWFQARPARRRSTPSFLCLVVLAKLQPYSGQYHYGCCRQTLAPARAQLSLRRRSLPAPGKAQRRSTIFLSFFFSLFQSLPSETQPTCLDVRLARRVAQAGFPFWSGCGLFPLRLQRLSQQAVRRRAILAPVERFS